MAFVDQVLSDGTIEQGEDTTLSPKQIKEIVELYFPNFKVLQDGTWICQKNNITYSMRFKNITYLGKPHKTFKKRIQIAEGLQDFVNRSIGKKMVPLLLGIYSYKGNYIFCDFNLDNYLLGKSNNCSAHVMVADLQAATVDGFFQKVDRKGNLITTFARSAVDVFLDNKFGSKKELSLPKIDDIKADSLDDGLMLVANTAISIFDLLEKKWNGIECYKEMMANNYRNKNQSEWAGFYLEYCFEKTIKEKSLEKIISFAQDKTDDGIDLDLLFPFINTFGDLKMHSNYSNGIQGNDMQTVLDLMTKENYSNHILYIVCQHATNKDKLFNYEVTRFWNSALNKPNLMSYSERMKHDVTLESLHVLDINSTNYQSLSVFRQGINNDGKPRKPKIMIDVDDLGIFEIKRKEF